MGVISFSIPQQLVNALITNIKVPNFVETGTYKGNTSIWASAYFEKVYTIEISPEFSEAASKRPDAGPNIKFITGDSKNEMPKLMKELIGPTLFWLDGHWCMNAGGKEHECPLLDELSAIIQKQDSIILIDDARCFLGPLPPPHRAEDWPLIDEIFAFIKSNFPGHTTTIIDDVIVSVPPEAKSNLENYWQQTFNKRFYDPAYVLKKYTVFQILKSFLK
jgi:hypothetical protein